MREALKAQAIPPGRDGTARTEDLFIVLCASGFDQPDRVRSALMFATLAAAAEYRTVLYCIQGAVDVMVKGAVERFEKPVEGVPTIAQRLQEAIETGVEIQCCSQTMANKKFSPEEMLDGVKVEGAMSLIELAAGSKGSLSF